MGESEFIPLPQVNDSAEVIFAERISQGPVDYLITRQKSVEVSGSSSFYDYVYKEYLKQYLSYRGELIQFRSRRTLYNLFPDHKKQIRDYARENGMVFIRRKINEKKKLVDYCNSLL